MTRLSKAGQPDYKPADRFINRWPVYKPVRLTIGSQHTHKQKLDLEHSCRASFRTYMCTEMCSSLVPLLLPSFLSHTIQNATKSLPRSLAPAQHFVAYCTVCDKKLERSLGMKLLQQCLVLAVLGFCRELRTVAQCLGCAKDRQC